ncbi:putative Ig domain-containing protein [Leucobacter luti]|uniref:putative Ig domain-containing protein n=1 Tax=Leucobacter luti TaxID=340320 RepID=UPI00140548F3|nr:putative Ig domain-containing protein [Leucobacter luti]MCW2289001.1 hypothetical protein [Leucobacter luti]
MADTKIALTASIDIGAGSGPESMAFSADGRLAYVLGQGDGTFNIVDLDTDSLTKKIHLGWEFAGQMVVNAAGTTAYIAVGTGYFESTMLVFDIASETVVEVRPGDYGGVGTIVLSPDESSYYVASLNGLFKVNAATGAVEASKVIADNTMTATVSKDGTRVYTHTLVQNETLRTLDASDLSELGAIATPDLNLEELTFGNDPNVLYAVGENSVYTYDLSAGTETSRQAVGMFMLDAALSADESRLFTVSNDWGYVMAANFDTGVRSESVRVIPKGSNKVKINPVTGDLYSSHRGWIDEYGSTLTRIYAPTATDPVDQTATKFGDIVTFTSDVLGVRPGHGGGTIWQYSDNGTDWTDIPGSAGKTLDVKVDTSALGMQYRLRYADDLFGVRGRTSPARILVDAPIITTPSLPNGEVGTPYSATIAATSADSPRLSVSNGALPAGVELNATTGKLSGKPTKAGAFKFEITASDGSGSTAREYVVTIVPAFVTNPPKQCAKPRKSPVFADVALTQKFYTEIDWMHCMKLSTGTRQPPAKPLYKPMDKLSREAMAAFMFRLEAPKNYTAPKVSPFADVKPGDAFYTQIAWMWEAKLSTGTAQASGKPLFKPKESLSREAMAAFIYRLESPKKYTAPKVSPMADMKPGMKFYKEISWMYSEKLTTGNKVGNTKEFWPKNKLSREAMAAFIYRLVTDYRK